MNISYADGSSKVGLILGLAGPDLRVAIQGADDPALFTLVRESWFAEDGRKVTFDFPLGLAGSMVLLTAIQDVTVDGLNIPRACESGGECLLKRMSNDPGGLN